MAGKKPPPKGRGRPKGSVNRFSKRLVAKLEKKGVDPVEHICDVMRQAELEGDHKLRLRAADALMPYAYPKLSSVDMSMQGSLAPVSIKVVPRGGTGDE